MTFKQVICEKYTIIAVITSMMRVYFKIIMIKASLVLTLSFNSISIKSIKNMLKTF